MIKGCLIPWIHLHKNLDGDYPLCCHINNQDVVNTKETPISEVWNGENMKKVRKQFLKGEYPKGCEVCLYKEANGATSHRQQVNQTYKKYAPLQLLTKKDGSIPNHPMWLDLRFSNKCNFKCRMCGPFASTAWIKDAEKLPEWFSKGTIKKDLDTSDDEVWSYLAKIKNSIQVIYFAGGEPLTTDSHYDLLKWLIKNNKTDITLWYNSNISILNYKNYNILKIWEKFFRVNVSVSIDGYKEHCEYTRTNFKWSIFIENLNKIEKYVDTATSTISVYSLLSFPKLLYFFKKRNIDCFANILVYPKHLDCRILPKELRKDIIFKLKALNFNISSPSVDALINFLETELENKDDCLIKFKKYTEALDRLNNTSFVDVYPELKEWYQKI